MEVRLILKKTTRGRNIFRLTSPQSTVGRAHGCAVRIPSADVSREHCRILIEEQTVTVQDLGSLNGTLLNGTLLDGVQEARPGDFLRVGPALFEVQFDPFAAGQESAGFEVLDDDEELAAGSAIVLEEADEAELDEPIPLVEAEEPLPVPTPEPQPNAEVSQSWQIPESSPGDLRDLLAHLDEPTDPEAPKLKKPKKRK